MRVSGVGYDTKVSANSCQSGRLLTKILKFGEAKGYLYMAGVDRPNGHDARCQRHPTGEIGPARAGVLAGPESVHQCTDVYIMYGSVHR